MIPGRYEIYIADLNPSIGSEIKKIRPAVIVSPDNMNKYLDTVVICPLTTKIHQSWRSRLQVNCEGKKAEIAVDQIRTISKMRLIRQIDKLDSEDAQQLRTLIVELYGE